MEGQMMNRQKIDRLHFAATQGEWTIHSDFYPDVITVDGDENKWLFAPLKYHEADIALIAALQSSWPAISKQLAAAEELTEVVSGFLSGWEDAGGEAEGVIGDHIGYLISELRHTLKAYQEGAE